MKKRIGTVLWASGLAGLLAMSSCAFPYGRAPKPVVSYGDVGTGNVAESQKSELLVFTRKTLLSMGDNPSVEVNEPYEVCDQGGGVLLKVRNCDPVTGQSPTPVSLSPGKYLLRYEDVAEIKECTLTVEPRRSSQVDMRLLHKPAN